MKKIFIFAALLLSLTRWAKAEYSDGTLAWLGDHKITIPDGMTSEQEKGLSWMVDNDCAPGKATVGGVLLDCSGDRVKDVNNYLNMVIATNLYAAWKSTSAASGSQVSGSSETKKATDEPAAKVSPADVLSEQTLGWLRDQKIEIPNGITLNQLKGLRWLANHDCPPGDTKVGGIPLSCSGDKVKDINDYLNLVIAANLYNAWNSN